MQFEQLTANSSTDDDFQPLWWINQFHKSDIAAVIACVTGRVVEFKTKTEYINYLLGHVQFCQATNKEEAYKFTRSKYAAGSYAIVCRHSENDWSRFVYLTIRPTTRNVSLFGVNVGAYIFAREIEQF